MRARDAVRRASTAVETAVSALVAALSFVAALIVGYATASYGLASGWAQLAAMATCVLTFTVASKLADAWLNHRKAGER